MEQVAKLLAEDLREAVRSSATQEELDQWLREPTYAVCGVCGRQALQRFEALNGRCEPCRLAYLQASGESLRSEGCPSCQGTGWSTRDTKLGPVVEKCQSCAPKKDERILEKLQHAGVLPEYYACTWITWKGAPPHEAREFIADPGHHGVLYIHGLQGRGKTHCATATFRKILEHGSRAFWRDCSQLVDQCRRWIANGSDDLIDEELHRLRGADLVLFDDLGSERQTEYSVDVIDGIIRWRHARQRPMIVTSNRSLAGLVTPREKGGLGRDPAIASRLRGLTVHLEGPDLRDPAKRGETTL